MLLFNFLARTRHVTLLNSNKYTCIYKQFAVKQSVAIKTQVLILVDIIVNKSQSTTDNKIRLTTYLVNYLSLTGPATWGTKLFGQYFNVNSLVYPIIDCFRRYLHDERLIIPKGTSALVDFMAHQTYLRKTVKKSWQQLKRVVVQDRIIQNTAKLIFHVAVSE